MVAYPHREIFMRETTSGVRLREWHRSSLMASRLWLREGDVVRSQVAQFEQRRVNSVDMSNYDLLIVR